MKTPRDIRDELLSTFLELESTYINGPTTTVPEKRIQYLEIEMCGYLLNAIKSLEFHYRDDVPGMSKKKNWDRILIKANKLIEKYSAESKAEKLILDKKFDDSGYLEHKEFMEGMSSKTR